MSVVFSVSFVSLACHCFSKRMWCVQDLVFYDCTPFFRCFLTSIFLSFCLSVCHVIMETLAVLFPFLPHPSFPPPYPTPRHHPSPRPPLTAIITPTTRPQAKSPSLCLQLSEVTPAAKPSGAALPQVPLNDPVSLPGSANNPYHLLTLCISSESHHLSTPYPS